MKKSLFFASVLAASTLVGCSSDEPAVNGGDNGPVEANYLSVKLVTSAPGSRAAGDDANYEDGTGNENTVNSVRFYFFDSEGKAATVKGGSNVNYMDWTEDITEGPGERPNVEKVLQATLIIESPKGDELPASVIAIVNPVGLGNESMSLSDLTGEVANYNVNSTNDYSHTDSFVMSNSVYADGTNKMVAVSVEGHIFPTGDAALANPVTIYVERVVAKVTLGLGSALTSGAIDVNGEKLFPSKNKDGVQNTFGGKNLYVKFLGWNVTYNTKKSRLIKEINPAWPANLFGTGVSAEEWNYAIFHRSFWAVNPTLAAEDYAKYDFENDGSAADMVTDFTNGHVYIQENASDSYTNGTNPTKPTKVIIAAQICDENGNDVEFAEWGFQKYAIDGDNGLKAIMANSAEVYKSNAEGTGRVKIEPGDITFKTATAVGQTQNGNYWVYAQVDDNKNLEFFTKDGTSMTKAQVNERLRNLGHAKVWTAGKTYYFFDIAHLGEENGSKGVVRNHVYKATINSLTGLGTPVYDPDEVIDPEKPDDDDTFIAAEIRILSWRIVNNNVDLDW